MIGNIIKKMRKEKGLSQKELAKKLNIAQTTLSGYETNYSNPVFSTINEIAKICDYEIIFKKKERNILNKKKEKSSSSNN